MSNTKLFKSFHGEDYYTGDSSKLVKYIDWRLCKHNNHPSLNNFANVFWLIETNMYNYARFEIYSFESKELVAVVTKELVDKFKRPGRTKVVLDILESIEDGTWLFYV